MPYHQITYAERYTRGLLRQRGLTPAAIAQVLGRHRSTIGREVQRNGTPRDGWYRPQLADWYARGRRSRSSRNRRFTPADWVRIQGLLREDWSPEQVAGWLRRHRELAISHETIYRSARVRKCDPVLMKLSAARVHSRTFASCGTSIKNRGIGRAAVGD